VDIERWLKNHQHKMELLRTVGTIAAATTGALMLWFLMRL